MACFLAVAPPSAQEPARGPLNPDALNACRAVRTRQRRWGAACALLLAMALAGMVDGMQGLMRSGADVVELLPGQGVSFSGPVGVKNPVNSDLQARFKPENAPLVFQLEGYFSGYWFGNGMWRGSVTADDGAEPGRYNLNVSFRGSAASPQPFTVVVHADPSAMRAASTFFLRRMTGWNPFVLAAALGLTGMAAAASVYRLGVRHISLLTAMGCGEVVRVSEDVEGCRVWCALFGARSPIEGALCAVMDAEGVCIGHARAGTARKGVLELLMAEDVPAGPEKERSMPYVVRPGCLVLARPTRRRAPPTADS